jgi:hypothetical protein
MSRWGSPPNRRGGILRVKTDFTVVGWVNFPALGDLLHVYRQSLSHISQMQTTQQKNEGRIIEEAPYHYLQMNLGSIIRNQIMSP